ncbi:MAG: hypothetical protein CVV27_16120 [Candidatus Melainabacteria bacterium HGW-Melainabacteria-1]|nr:MAG: hypothetical protein CVV27_16120 [Candidatus Melainabacteria bacterium HGW-Melainabacteria-1]
MVVAGLAACSPAGQSTLPPGQQTAPGTLSAAEINAKVDLFDAMLLVKGADGVVNPVTPERIESLSIDGKVIAANAIVLPGSTNAEAYSAEKARLDLATKSANGQPQAFFGGNGAYSFLLPKTGKNSTLALKLKGDSQNYQLVRVSNLSRGTFLLSGGQITGGFNTRGEFQVKQNGSNPLADLQAMFLGSYFALSQFDINGFVNYYQANQGQVTITTQNNQRLVFEASNSEQPSSQGSASEADLNAAREQLQSEVGANISDLLGYIGSWTLESDLVKALVPGGAFSLEVSKTGTDTYRLTANLASGAYSGEGRHVAGSASGSDLKLGVSAGSKSLEVEFRLENSNRAGVKLTKAEGVAELSALVGTEIFLRRAL